MTALPEILPSYLVVACLPCLFSICEVFASVGCREEALTCLTSVSCFLIESGIPVFSLAETLADEKTRPVQIYVVVCCNSAAAGKLGGSSPKHGDSDTVRYMKAPKYYSMILKKM